MKLDKELYIKQANRLNAILSDKSPFITYLTKPDFVKVLEISLNTLYAIEKKLLNADKLTKFSAHILMVKFNKLGKNTIKLDEKFKFDDETELIDNINYLFTYCKNIFQVNLDDLVCGKTVKIVNPKANLRSKTDVEEVLDSKVPPGISLSSIGGYEDTMVIGQAYAKVRADIASGKIFTYTSKPKIIPIAKIISIITILLATLSLIFAAIFAFMSVNYQVEYGESGSPKIDGLKFNAIGPGIMYLLIAGFSSYPLYLIIKSLVSHNDNLKFYFNWPWLLMFILMVLLFVMPDMRVTWFLTSGYKHEQSSAARIGFEAWKVLYILSLATSGLCLVPMIMGAVNNPKQDKALLQNLLRQYANETSVSNESISVDNSKTSTSANSEEEKLTKSSSTETK